MKVETLETTLRNAMKSIKELDKGLAFLNSKVKELTKLQKDCTGKGFFTWEFTKEEKTFIVYGIEQRSRGHEASTDRFLTIRAWHRGCQRYRVSESSQNWPF